MHSEGSAFLVALQHGDSFFPGGTQAFSWGLETLAADDLVTTAVQLNEFVSSQLRWRWNFSDRPTLVECYSIQISLAEIIALDELVETRMLNTENRDCSRRAGEAMLSLYASMGNLVAVDYKDYVSTGRARGHNAIVQAMIWNDLGIDCLCAQYLSAHMLRVQLVSAAIRLGIIGHINAQKIIAGQQSLIDRLLTEDAIPAARIGVFTPQIEIAMMRHEYAPSRMFAN